jgi:hypothetical protein
MILMDDSIDFHQQKKSPCFAAGAFSGLDLWISS